MVRWLVLYPLIAAAVIDLLLHYREEIANLLLVLVMLWIILLPLRLMALLFRICGGAFALVVSVVGLGLLFGGDDGEV